MREGKEKYGREKEKYSFPSIPSRKVRFGKICAWGALFCGQYSMPVSYTHLDVYKRPLHDSENLLSLAVDAAAYYEKNYRDTGYLDGLEAKRREVEKSLANLVKVIESGLISETVTERLVQLEEQKRALNEAIEAENIRAALCEDEHTIKAYFEKFLHADFDNPETRDQVLEYFVDKIYLTDDGLVVTSWYSEDRTTVTWDMLYGEDGNPFVKGEAVKFDCFPFGSTIKNRSV